MINVPNEIKELCKQDSISKNFRVHFVNGEYRDLVNADFVSESVVFTESVSSASKLKFGLCEKSTISFNMFFDANIKNLAIFCTIEIDISSLSQSIIDTYGVTSSDVSFVFYPIPYGYFVVTSCKLQNSNIWNVEGQQIGDISIGFPDIEKIKMLEPINLHKWFGVSLSDSPEHKYVYKLSYKKFLCETYNSCDILNELPVNVYTSTGTAQPIKVADCPGTMPIYRWCAPMTFDYDSPSANQFMSGLPQDAVISIVGIKIPFDVSSQASYDVNNYGIAVSGSAYNQTANLLPSKNYIYQLSWKTDISYSRTNIRERLQDWAKPIYDVLGDDFFTELTKPCLKFEYDPTCKYSTQTPQVNYPNEVDTIIGASFSTILNATGEDPISREGTDPGGHIIHSAYKDYWATMSYFAFKKKLEDESIALNSRFVLYHSPDSVIPNIDVPERCGRYNYMFKNSIMTGMYNSQMIRSFDYVKSVDNQTQLVINPYMHIVDATDNTDVEQQITTGHIPHLTLCIPTRIYISYGTDINRGSVNTPLDICSSSPRGGYSRDIINLDSLTDFKIEQYYVNDSEDNITVPYDYATVKMDTKFYSVNYPQITSEDVDYERPGKNEMYFGYDFDFSPSTGKLVDSLSYRCSPELFNNFSDNTAMLEVSELNSTFIRFVRDVMGKSKIIKISDVDGGLYPSEDIYPDTQLFPSGTVAMLVTRNLWYSTSIDTIYEAPYNIVSCTMKFENEDVTLTSVIFDDENYFEYAEPSYYDVSNNELITSGVYTRMEVQAILDSIAKNLKDLYYSSVNMKMKGLPYVEAGDRLRILLKGRGINTVVLRHRISGIQSLIDTIETR